MSETRNCQSCQKSFILEPDNLSFYEKIKVPAPTWCPECRFIRRMVFRNENKLYHRADNAPPRDGQVPGQTGKKIISIYSDTAPVVVYDREYWWGDGWDPYSYGRDYDFSKPFFEQMKELIQTVPWPSLMNWNPVNSDYCNCTTDNKNCYLVFGGDFNEDCSYATFNMHTRDSQDLYLVTKCDLCYECSDAIECSKVRFADRVKGCSDSMFLYDCVNCVNCIGCVGLRNKSNCIWNEQYTKEEYKKKLEEMALDTNTGISKMKELFADFKLKFPHRYAYIVKSVDCTGDNIGNAKNCKNCFEIDGGEDLKDVFLAPGLKDSQSCSHAGHGAELSYESFGFFSGVRNIKFCIYQPSSNDATYAYNCPTSSNIFGCVGIKSGSYSILNKKYSKEEYEALKEKIIKHMDEMPYVDQKGRVYKYGEFYPPELSPFAYNETIAQEYHPLSKEEALAKGFTWKEKEERNYKIDIKTEDLPENISPVGEDVLKKVIECAHKGACNENCTEAFRLTAQELQFYKRLNLPIPKLCPNCRHYTRLKKRNPLKLWKRSCHCAGASSKSQEASSHVYQNTAKHIHGDAPCDHEFETSYAPNRPEIIYCEQCYQQEVN